MTELTKLPIIKGIESVEAYQEHKAALMSELAPASMIEMMLADQMARDMWEKKRLEEYVAVLLDKKVGGVEKDLQSWWEYDYRGRGKLERNYKNMISMSRFYEETISGLHIFRTLDEHADNELLDGKLTVLGMWALAQSARCKTEAETITGAGHIVPGEDGKIYPYNDEESLHSDWTVKRAKACATFLATKAKRTVSKLVELALKRDKAQATKYCTALMAIKRKEKQLLSEQGLKLGKVLPAIREIREDQNKLTSNILDAFAKLEELKQRQQDNEQSEQLPIVTVSQPLLSGDSLFL